MKADQVLRLTLLLLAVGAAGLAVRALVGPWLPPTATTGFADLVTAGCALALAACWAWLAAGTLLVAARSLREAATPLPGTLRWVPRTIRVLVPALLGVAVTAAPASAGTDPGAADPVAGTPRSTLAGLPLPDRVPTRVPTRDPARDPARDTDGDTGGRTVLVRPGDSLWRITARLLPPGAPAAAVDGGWRRIARANAGRVPDPDLILPGTRLRVPPLPAHPREES